MSCNSCNRNTNNSNRNYPSRNIQYNRMHNQTHHGNHDSDMRTPHHTTSYHDCECDHDSTSNTEYETTNYDKGCMTSLRKMSAVDSMMIGIGYVPFQQWRNIYDFEKAFCSGTIFEDLDKPWIGRC